MAKDIKGITIKIGGDADGFKKALKEMNTATQSVQKELNAVNKSLSFDPKNVDLLKQKEELLGKQLENVRIKVDKLKAAKEQADKEMADGTEVNQEKYRQLVREISAAEGHLKSLEKQNKETQSSANKTKDILVNIGKGGLAVSGAIIGIGTAAVGAMTAAAEETREYREDMNKLETAFKTGGFTVDAAKKSYEDFYTVLGETDRSVEAVNHLARFVTTEQDLVRWSDIAAGVTATFGDSLPIEGLTEAANETVKVGQVTGVLADALNWAGINEDKFNEKLAKCNSEKERSELITTTLDNAYKDAATTYKELNADIIANRKATSEANDQMAELGASSEGVSTKLKEAKNTITAAVLPTIGKLADKISDLDEGQVMLLGGIGAVGVAVPTVVTGIGSMITAVKTIKAEYDKLTVSATAASIASKAIPFIGVAVAATGLIGVLSAVASATDEETKKAKELHEANMQRYEDYKKLKENAQEQAEASLSEMSHIGKLKDELMLLADENGRVADSDKARAEFILGQLNGALGTEYTMTGNLIEKYGELTTSIDELILKKKAEIILSSKEDAYKAAVKNIEGQKAAYDAAKSAHSDAFKAFKEYQEGIRNGTIIITRDTALQLDAFRRDAEEKEKILAEAAEAYDTSLSDIRDYEEAAASIIEDGGKKIVEGFDRNAGLATEKGEKTAENFNKGMESTDVETTAKEVGQKAVNALGSGTEMDDEGNTPESLGGNVVDGLIKGFDYKLPLLETRAKEMGKTIITALKSKDGLDVNSPAKPAIPIGEAVVEGVAVGITKDMSAEEALEKKCSNLKKILSDFTADFKADIELAESEYDLWLSNNPNASGAEKASHQRSMYTRMLAGHQQNVQNINDALWYQGELTGTDSTEYEQMLADLNKAKAELNEIKETLVKSELVPQFSQTNIDLAESHLILWKAQNPDATEYDKLIQEEKKLNVEYEEQGKKVQDLNDELYLQIQLNGENADESKKLLAQLNEEKAAYEQLAAQIRNVNEQKSQYTGTGGGISGSSGGRSAASVYASYHVQYGAMLKSQGVSQEAIDAAARKVSGYEGKNSININNYNYGVTSDTAYKVSKETAKTANNLAMQGVL